MCVCVRRSEHGASAASSAPRVIRGAVDVALAELELMGLQEGGVERKREHGHADLLVVVRDCDVTRHRLVGAVKLHHVFAVLALQRLGAENLPPVAAHREERLCGGGDQME